MKLSNLLFLFSWVNFASIQPVTASLLFFTSSFSSVPPCSDFSFFLWSLSSLSLCLSVLLPFCSSLLALFSSVPPCSDLSRHENGKWKKKTLNINTDQCKRSERSITPQGRASRSSAPVGVEGAKHPQSSWVLEPSGSVWGLIFTWIIKTTTMNF